MANAPRTDNDEILRLKQENDNLREEIKRLKQRTGKVGVMSSAPLAPQEHLARSQSDSSYQHSYPTSRAEKQTITLALLTNYTDFAVILAELMKAGVLDHIPEDMKQSVPITEIASATKLKETYLYRVMRALSCVGIFCERPGKRFSHTAFTLSRKSTGTKRYRQLMYGSEEWANLWSAISYTLREGIPAFNAKNNTESYYSEYMNREGNQEHRSFFDKFMQERSFGRGMYKFGKDYPWENFDFIYDVGGGAGHLLCEILGEHPKLRGIVGDMKAVITEGADNIAKHGFQDRAEAIEIDFFKPLPKVSSSGATCYTLKVIIHNWDDDSCVRILSNISKIMRPDDRIVLIEQIIDDQLNHFQYRKIADLLMMTTFSGAERTVSEYEELVNKAGLDLESVIHCDPQDVDEYTNLMEGTCQFITLKKSL